MRKFFLASAAFAAIATTASAADLPARPYTKAPAMVPTPVYTWTGFYIGGHVGGAFRDGSDPFGGGGNDGRFLGGGQIGADYQFSGSWLVGVQAQYSFVDNRTGTPFAFPGGTFSDGLRGLGSATGRLGYVWGPALLYVKGGYAYADTRNIGFGAFQFNNNRDGYTIGAGVEYMLAQNWSGMIEYQYYDFRRSSLFVGAPLVFIGSVRDDEHTIKAGVNYHFNLAGLLPSRY